MARILVVEDDDEIRELLAEALKRWGHDPVLTANGQQGLDRYRAESFELMVSDIRMPVMDGLTLLKTIRETDHRMPVVIVTAYPTVDSAVESLGVGADHYLVKPINLDDLKAKVDKCLEKRRMQSETDKLRRLVRWQWAFLLLAAAVGYLLATWF